MAMNPFQFWMQAADMWQKSWASAIESYQEAVAKKPDFYQAYSDMGYAYRKTGDYEKSLAAYDKALQINPEYPQALEYVGEAYLAVGDKAKAREHLAALEKLCGRECEEYRDLAKAIADAK